MSDSNFFRFIRSSRLSLLGASLAMCSLTTAFAIPTLPEKSNPVTPVRGIAYSADDIMAVRHEVNAREANKELVEEIFEISNQWLGRSEAEIIELIPKAGSLFAVGSAGDPKADKPWPRFARSGDMCSFDRPGTVRSPHTGDIYGKAKPGEPYYDDGKGWKRPSDGQMFYFDGVWNTWVIVQLHAAIDNLALAYMLTGDVKYAERALFILDRLATLRIQMPIAGNTLVDWPHNSRPESVKSFFSYSGNHANQRAINTAMVFDLVGNVPFAQKPSAGDASLSISENIEKNYFDIYERYYLEPTFRALTNHGIVLVANLITQGVLFGRADDLREGIDGMYAFFDNTIDRDGDYMEASGSYGRLGRDYGSRLVMPLIRYNPENYPNAAEMPNPADYPRELKMGDDPRWYKTAVGMLYRLPVLGRYPQYGDMSMDRAVLLDEDNVWLAKARAMYLRMLYFQTTREDWKREIETLYERAAQQKMSPLMLDELLLYGIGMWKEPAAPAADVTVDLPQDRSDLIPVKGIAVLRSGEKENARALFLRGGMNSWHGNDDQMSIVPYGHGMVLFGKYGYHWANTPDNLGWGTRSVSMHSLVVNEDMPPQYLYKGFDGRVPSPAASVSGYLANVPGPVQMIEMNNPQLYSRAGLSDYRRAGWLVDVDPERYYFVDIFHVIGGRTHDYVWNSHYIDPKLKAAGKDFRIEGIEPKGQEDIWTLASLGNERFRDVDWNKPGQSWGERLVGHNGMITALPGQERLPTTRWNPEPRNGYGFIWDVKTDDTANDWRAIWPMQDGKHSMRAHLLNYDGMTAVTALSPSLTPDNNFNVIVGRRTREGEERLRSRFANVVEVGKEGEWTVSATNRLDVQAAEPQDVAALSVQAGDFTDYLIASRAVQAIRTDKVSIDGRNAFARFDKAGKLIAFSLQEGTLFEAGGWKAQFAQAAFNMRVLGVYPGENESRLVVEGELPVGDSLAGVPLLIGSSVGGSAGYPHNDFYEIETVESSANGRSVLLFRKQSLINSTLQLEEIIDADSGEVQLYWNHTLAGKAGTLAYRGRGVVDSGKSADESAPVAALINAVDGRKIKMSTVRNLKAGSRVDVLVTKPGDIATILSSVSVAEATGADGKTVSGVWDVRASMPLQLHLPADATGASAKAVVLSVPAGNSRIEAGRLSPAAQR